MFLPASSLKYCVHYLCICKDFVWCEVSANVVVVHAFNAWDLSIISKLNMPIGLDKCEETFNMNHWKCLKLRDFSFMSIPIMRLPCTQMWLHTLYNRVCMQPSYRRTQGLSMYCEALIYIYTHDKWVYLSQT